VADDLLVTAPGRDLVAHLLAQVARQLGIGIGERLVLADQAAQLLLELANSLFIFNRHSREGEKNENGEKQWPHFFSAVASGRIFCSRMAGVSGPICL